jgi:diacylglycerol kinase (ATP)
MNGEAHMDIALVLNPRSGSIGDPADVVALLERHGATVERFDIDEHARCADGRPDRIVVAGGDGTLGCCARVAADAGIPLAILPTGTANDFARALGLPLDHEEAARLAVDPASSTEPVEILVADDDRAFVNVASAGLGVVAAREAAGMKKRLGPLAYGVGALHAALTARAIAVTVSLDGDEWWTGRAWQVLVCGTGRFGGGSAVGDTELDDGLIDVAVVPAGPRLALARRGFGMRRGTLNAQDAVPHERARAVTVAITDGVTGFNVDGELVDTRSLAVAVHPRRVDVVRP